MNKPSIENADAYRTLQLIFYKIVLWLILIYLNIPWTQ